MFPPPARYYAIRHCVAAVTLYYYAISATADVIMSASPAIVLPEACCCCLIRQMRFHGASALFVTSGVAALRDTKQRNIRGTRYVSIQITEMLMLLPLVMPLRYFAKIRLLRCCHAIRPRRCCYAVCDSTGVECLYHTLLLLLLRRHCFTRCFHTRCFFAMPLSPYCHDYFFRRVFII